MDSLTHIVLGAAIGEVVLGKKIGRKAMLWGALADTIPDFDVFTGIVVPEAQQLLFHRGFTHSFLFAVIMAPLMGWWFSRLFKKSPATRKDWTLLFFLGFITHIVLDSFTAYGTGWFEPFNHYRVSFNTIFVADLFYTLPFLICVVVAIIAKNNSPSRIRWNKAGLWISCLYLLYTLVNKAYVNSEVKEAYEKKNIATTDFVTTPTPLNNFLWMTYVPDRTGYWMGYYSVFDKTNDIQFFHFLKNDSLLKPYENGESAKLLKRFSKGYYCLTKTKDGVYFNDIRFGQMGGWDGSDPAFVFSFMLKDDGKSKQSLDRTKFKTSMKEAFLSVVKRAKGI
ncbi:MAG TPA: metal-dependent hydrolase [Bacteroidia bacterium]|jgi:inner membrane protein|nr:metal-dependent hydrolase [Bacteroidia bacterium]